MIIGTLAGNYKVLRDRFVRCVLAIAGGSFRRILERFFFLGGGRGGGVASLLPCEVSQTSNIGYGCHKQQLLLHYDVSISLLSYA